jgi:hypothetical protein
MDEKIIDVTTDQGVPFRVVYGKRQFRDGSWSTGRVVAFYDRRNQFDTHGQFVSDYNRETLLERRPGYGLDLQGNEPSWYVDATAMHVIMTWLNCMALQEENYAL